MFINSNRVRQLISNILGLSQLVDQNTNAPEELKEYLDYIKQFFLSLDIFTKDLTLFISELEKKGKQNLYKSAFIFILWLVLKY